MICRDVLCLVMEDSNWFLFRTMSLGDCVARSLLLHALGWQRSSPAPCSSPSCRNTFWHLCRNGLFSQSVTQSVTQSVCPSVCQTCAWNLPKTNITRTRQFGLTHQNALGSLRCCASARSTRLILITCMLYKIIEAVQSCSHLALFHPIKVTTQHKIHTATIWKFPMRGDIRMHNVLSV